MFGEIALGHHYMAALDRSRVVITGLGIVAPNGIGKDAFWESLLRAESGIDHITLFDASKHPCKIAGEVKDFDINKILDRPGFSKRRSRQDLLAAAAAHLAYLDADLDPTSRNGSMLDVCLGISCPAVELIEHGFERLQSHGPWRVPVHVATSGQPHHAATTITDAIPSVRKAHTHSSACIAGSEAIASGFELIRTGRADIVIAGGADAPINSLTYACMAQSGLLTGRQVDPRLASCPFDIAHDAGIISEGAGLLVLESLEHANYRGKKPYAEILSTAFCQDFSEETPCSGLEVAMHSAMQNAGLIPDDIGYINAHGPSHRILDCAEASVIKKVFGPRAYQIPITSIKGVLGNPLAAAGPLQIAATLLALQSGTIPPTANLNNPDPACDLDFVPGQPRRTHCSTALVDVHGLGGGNACVIVKKI